MATPPKYQKGMRIEKIEDAVAFLLAGGWFFIPGNVRPVSYKFLQNWSIAQLQKCIKGNYLYLAERRTQ
jgi:hypothetical protein